MKKISPTTEEIKNAAFEIPKISKKENWIVILDRDEDTLFFAPKRIPREAELFHVNDEFSIYLDSKKQVRGLMVEYYENNFNKHHQTIKELSEEIFTNKKKVIIKLDSKNKKKVRHFQDAFIATLLSETGGASFHP